ncbi:MAG: L-histidine N(alpha)-methyltransferase [Bacteroidota bacterium]
MQNNTETIFETSFQQEVHQGLTDFPKHLSSKFFYDTPGDRLFQDIMAMPEYYLTNSEFEILDTYTKEITEWFFRDGKPFDLIELGAGDGKKTKILLRHLLEQKVNFIYKPIDISPNALEHLERSLHTELPEMNIEPKQGTYFETLASLNVQNGKKKVILFLGSNIGNLLHPQAVDFLKGVGNLMQEDDLFFVGFDQKKHPQAILDAYNDQAGITEAFNKNLLARINRELGANFDLDKFLHWEVYDPETGTAKSFLVSKEGQTVSLPKIDLTVTFKPWETIHTEISQKYDDAIVHWLAQKAGLEIRDQWEDKRSFYKDYLFKKK